MLEPMLVVMSVLLLAVIGLQIVLLRRKVALDLSPVNAAFQAVQASYERTERAVRDEIARNRDEAANTAKLGRDELAATLKAVGDTLDGRLGDIRKDNGDRLDQMRQEATAAAQKAREEVTVALTTFSEFLKAQLTELGSSQRAQLGNVVEQLTRLTETNEKKLDAQRAAVDQRLVQIQTEQANSAKQMREDNGTRLDQMRQEATAAAQKAREEVTVALKTFSEFLKAQLTELGSSQRTQLGNVVEQLTRLTETNEKKLDAQRTTVDQRLVQIQAEQAAAAKQMREEVGKLTDSNQQKLDSLKSAVEEKLKHIQEDNSKQLDQMRATVDEKLQTTLEKRLGESFKQVSERLEAVFKGLGEMQVLATGVGDLKRVLTNVKTRGTWGEVQLGAMLEQVLTPEQYDKNVATKDGGDRVEFAVRLPGRSDDSSEHVWLPIDAKFPVEDYQRLVEAQEKADPEAAEQAAKQLEIRIKQCAKDICDKYVGPPRTTDFAILFLPIEGLFAEVIRRTGLCDYVQRECRIVIAGPTTLWSLLNSLQMGFKTLAIQQRSSEVWKLLAAVKVEFNRYGEVLGKVQKKLTEAVETIDRDVAVRTRAINRRLKAVEELPANQAPGLLTFGAAEAEGDGEEG